MVCTSRSNTGSSPCVSCHKQHLCEQSTVARKLMEGDGLPAASLIGAMAKSSSSYMVYTYMHMFSPPRIISRKPVIAGIKSICCLGTVEKCARQHQLCRPEKNELRGRRKAQTMSV